MALKERQKLIRTIQRLRPGRKLVCICNLDRAVDPQNLPGLSVQFQEDLKEPLFRVLKQSVRPGDSLDVFLYTRGGATNAVWPVTCLLREFDADFQVLVPFRAHSSGTMVALGSSKIIMGPLAELSPIDPTTANQFNPRDPLNQQAMLGIAVEDVRSYQEFWKEYIEIEKENGLALAEKYALLQPHISRLATEIHPLALGNVHRIYRQIRVLAKMLLAKNYGDDEVKLRPIMDSFTKEYYSHHHMISRGEAKDILGSDHVEFASEQLSAAMDALLRQYEEDFQLRHPFFLGRFMADDIEKTARFISGIVESSAWSYLNETEMRVRQYLAPPPGVQIQVPPGTVAPLVPGLPRTYQWQVMEQGWRRNVTPKGVTT